MFIRTKYKLQSVCYLFCTQEIKQKNLKNLYKKISPNKDLHKTKHIYTNIKHKLFEELVLLVPLVLPL